MQGSKSIAVGHGSEVEVFVYRMGLAAIAAAVAISVAIKRHHRIQHTTQIRIHSQVPAIISRVNSMIWAKNKSAPNKRLKLEWDLEYAIMASAKVENITLQSILCPNPKKAQKSSPRWTILSALQQLVRTHLKKEKG